MSVGLSVCMNGYVVVDLGECGDELSQKGVAEIEFITLGNLLVGRVDFATPLLSDQLTAFDNNMQSEVAKCEHSRNGQFDDTNIRHGQGYVIREWSSVLGLQSNARKCSHNKAGS